MGEEEQPEVQKIPVSLGGVIPSLADLEHLSLRTSGPGGSPPGSDAISSDIIGE